MYMQGKYAVDKSRNYVIINVFTPPLQALTCR